MGSKKQRHKDKLARRQAAYERPQGTTPESADERKRIAGWRKQVKKAITKPDPRSQEG